MEIEDIKGIKSYSEAARKYLDINYYNANVKKKVLQFFQEMGFNIEEIIKNNASLKPKRCLECGKEFIPKHKSRKFCSSSCAAKYNNIRRAPVSEETKNKTSKTLLKRIYGEKWEEEAKMRKHRRRRFKCICNICGKEFISYKKDAKHCSNQCSSKDLGTREKIQSKMLEKVKNGTHKGWQSRKIESYPEKFWKRVLKENSIDYKREDFSTKKYFLDFLIVKNEKKVDLEIDEKQHKYRKEHDTKRDAFLKENGFIVYRIEWNSINTESGREKMKRKIDEFIDFYNNL